MITTTTRFAGTTVLPTFTADAELFADAVRFAHSAADGSDPPAPMLLAVTDGQLTISCLTYEHSHHITLPVAATGNGQVRLSARALADYVRRLPRAALHALPGVDRHWALTCQGHLSTFATLPDDGPHTATAGPEPGWDIDSRTLATMLTRVRSAAGTDPNVPALSSISLNIGPSGLTLTATDRHRLAVAHHRSPTTADPRSVAVPAAALARAVAHFATYPLPVRIGWTSSAPGSLVTLHCGPAEAVLTAGAAAPDVARLLAADTPTRVVLKARSLIRAVTQLAEQAKADQPLHLHATGDQLQLTVTTSDGGTASTPVRGRVVGPQTTVAVQHRYLLAAVKSFPAAATVVLGMQGPGRPIVLTSTDADADGYRHLIGATIIHT